MSCRNSVGKLGAAVYRFTPLFGRGTKPFRRALAVASMGTALFGNVAPIAGSIGNAQPEATTGLKLAEPGSHSLKSPWRILLVGTPRSMMVPSRFLRHSSDTKKKVLFRSTL